MPIITHDNLPAKRVLEKENIFILSKEKKIVENKSKVKVIILNLMPTKIITETQLIRQLSNSPLSIEVDFLRTVSRKQKNTDPAHLDEFYLCFDDIKDKNYDGMIMTGAPVENMKFEEVGYWDELCEIMQWSKVNVRSTFNICWGAQAALYYHFGVNKYSLEKKISGVFKHNVLKPKSKFFSGFDDEFSVPHSRYTENRASDILAVSELELLSTSDEAGVLAAKSVDNKNIFVTGHPEYNLDTLALEYFRDVEKGMDIDIPKNYFPDNDVTKKPIVNWRAHAGLMYLNWINHYVYNG